MAVRVPGELAPCGRAREWESDTAQRQSGPDVPSQRPPPSLRGSGAAGRVMPTAGGRQGGGGTIHLVQMGGAHGVCVCVCAQKHRPASHTGVEVTAGWCPPVAPPAEALRATQEGFVPGPGAPTPLRWGPGSL